MALTRAEKASRYRLAHPDKVASAKKRHRGKNRAVEAARMKRWREANPEQRYEQKSRRRSREKQATPKWANKFLMRTFAVLARGRTKLLGLSWEVDHIVPLHNALVCGLNWEGNLRVIPAKENGEKGNRSWPDMPGVVQIKKTCHTVSDSAPLRSEPITPRWAVPVPPHSAGSSVHNFRLSTNGVQA